MSLLINKKAVKSAITSTNPELRVSEEFYQTLDAILRDRILKAIQRNKSTSLKTLKKDQLYM